MRLLLALIAPERKKIIKKRVDEVKITSSNKLTIGKKAIGITFHFVVFFILKVFQFLKSVKLV